MSKPLELAVYPPIAPEPIGDDLEPWTWDDLQEWNTARWMEERAVKRMRLTDVELTAEYWCAQLDYRVESEYGFDIETFAGRAETMERFATTPSYDEAAP